MINIGCEYNIKEDSNFILETERINSADLSERTKVSRTTLDGIQKRGKARDDVCEKIYSYAYENKYRINSVKEEQSVPHPSSCKILRIAGVGVAFTAKYSLNPSFHENALYKSRAVCLIPFSSYK